MQSARLLHACKAKLMSSAGIQVRRLGVVIFMVGGGIDVAGSKG